MCHQFKTADAPGGHSDSAAWGHSRPEIMGNDVVWRFLTPTLVHETCWNFSAIYSRSKLYKFNVLSALGVKIGNVGILDLK